jgi:hypothetical protein
MDGQKLTRQRPSRAGLFLVRKTDVACKPNDRHQRSLLKSCTMPRHFAEGAQIALCATLCRWVPRYSCVRSVKLSARGVRFWILQVSTLYEDAMLQKVANPHERFPMVESNGFAHEIRTLPRAMRAGALSRWWQSAVRTSTGSIAWPMRFADASC